MKTKEYSGHVYINHVPWIAEGVKMPFLPEGFSEIGDGEKVKAKLIIEIPEKKIELTESQFDEAIKDCFTDGGYFIGKDKLKQKLFNHGSEDG